jgi:hypothetical protein
MLFVQSLAGVHILKVGTLEAHKTGSPNLELPVNV